MNRQKQVKMQPTQLLSYFWMASSRPNYSGKSSSTFTVFFMENKYTAGNGPIETQRCAVIS